MKYRSNHTLSFTFYAIVVCILIALAYLGSKTVTVIAENKPVKAYRTIIIDAGHGGIDGGATSCTGILEKDINLEIAVRLNDLMQLLGIQTRMIRTEDRSMDTAGETIAAKKVSDLKERVSTVNSVKDGFLISIHQNYFPDNRYSGAQIFYSSNNESKDFAKLLQESFISALNPGSNRQAKKATGVYLMDRIDGPGVLIECGFLSNFREESLLRMPEYQKKVCCVIASQTSIFLHNDNLA